MTVADLNDPLVIVDCFTSASESAALTAVLQGLVDEHRGHVGLLRVNVEQNGTWWKNDALPAPRVAIFANGILIDALGRSGDAAPAAEIVASFVQRRIRAGDDDCEGGTCLI